MPINTINTKQVDVLREHCAPDGEGNALDWYQELASGSAFYPGQGTALGLLYCALKLNGEAGELAEHVGKAMRDDGLTYDVADGMGNYQFNNLTPERRTLIIKEIGDNLWYLSALCRELGINLSTAAIHNLDKLADRQARNRLQGSGDER